MRSLARSSFSSVRCQSGKNSQSTTRFSGGSTRTRTHGTISIRFHPAPVTPEPFQLCMDQREPHQRGPHRASSGEFGLRSLLQAIDVFGRWTSVSKLVKDLSVLNTCILLTKDRAVEFCSQNPLDFFAGGHRNFLSITPATVSGIAPSSI